MILTLLLIYFDEVINPISAYKQDEMKELSEVKLDDEEFDEFELPEESSQPLLEEDPLYTEEYSEWYQFTLGHHILLTRDQEEQEETMIFHSLMLGSKKDVLKDIQ